MNKYQLLKKLLPGLFPLIIFIIVDEFYGTSAGLMVAVSFGITQLIFTYFKNRVFDKFTLFDTLLIVILGSVSYILDNDIFFKLKPALVGAILCILLGISAFSKLNIFALMSKRYFEGINFNDEQIKQFNRSIKVLFFIFSFHTLLVLYSAFFMSKEAWAFISTVLFYLLFGIYFLYELVKTKIKNLKYRKEEWLPLVDEKGKIVGNAPRSLVHKNKDLLHPVVHLHVINKNQELYLQKRLSTKLVQPGKWDTAVGGHVGLNETIEITLKREAEEEVGIRDFKAIALCHYIWKTEIESELVFLLYTKYDGKLKFNPNEIEEGRFWKRSELNDQLGKCTLTPNFEMEFEILKRSSLI
jgi:isopentenyldiphosphate isomerase/intracellular septation protein A